MSNRITLLEAILRVADIAGGVAKECKLQESLRTLLVQVKSQDQANPRFLRDFKTLADVLIQQLVAKRLSDQFPELQGHIYGEENNSFTNSLGETLIVEIKESQQETADLLLKVLDGNYEAAKLLAAAAHRNSDDLHINMQISECLNLDIPVTDLGIWIDPIDSTAEYVQGEEDSPEEGHISSSGLRCVTVLIGVFDIITGTPLMGVVNQPFYKGSEGRCLWGVSHGDKKIFFNPEREEVSESRQTQTVCTSSSEDEAVKRKLSEGGYRVAEAAGAGYKLLMVILGHADAYVLSKASTYKWDTCGPHALLSSLGGGILDYASAVTAVDPETCQIRYSSSASSSASADRCNAGGIIAYRDKQVLRKLIKLLSQ